MKENLREQINNIILASSSESTQYLIAQEIIRKLNNNEKLVATKIAENAFTSKPSVIRFAQHFGFLGFKEFNEEITKQESIYYTPYATVEYHDSYRNFDAALARVINQLAKQRDVIIDIADLIYEKRRLFVLSSPENIQLGNEFADRLRFLGIEVFNATLLDKQILLLNHFQRGDLVLFLVSGFDAGSVTKMFYDVREEGTTAVVSVITKANKFQEADYLVNVKPELGPLRVVYKRNGTRHVLDQIFELLVYHDENFINLIVDPKFRV